MIVGADGNFGGWWVMVGLIAIVLSFILFMVLIGFALLAGVVGKRKRAESSRDLDSWDRR